MFPAVHATDLDVREHKSFVGISEEQKILLWK